jgi:hypothetical protein
VPPPRRNWILSIPPWTPLANFMAFALEHFPGWLIRPFVLSFLTTALGLTDRLFQQGAMLVNRRGERFCDEFDKPVWKLAEQPQQSGYVILDRTLAERFTACSLPPATWLFGESGLSFCSPNWSGERLVDSFGHSLYFHTFGCSA